MEIIEIINTPKMAIAATRMSKGLAKVWAEREFLFWKSLTIKLEEYLKNKKNWGMEGYNFSIKDSSTDDLIKEIYEKRTKDNDLGLRLNLNKNNFYFLIYSYSKSNFKYQIEFESKSDIEKLAKLIDFKYKYKNARYCESKYALNFCKDYEEPTYDIFDNDKLDKIVENIYNEIKSYMDIIVKELN